MTRALLTSLSVLVSGCGVASQGQSSSLVEIVSLARRLCHRIGQGADLLAVSAVGRPHERLRVR